uniref:hypothetical protein n=1 Tax=uncultured Deinococcus sp. TaxID=158789 RepID=UPI0025DAC551
MVTVRAQNLVTSQGARTAVLLATAATGTPVSAAKLTTCWRQVSGGSSRFLVSGGFEAPSVLCVALGGVGTVLVPLVCSPKTGRSGLDTQARP